MQLDSNLVTSVAGAISAFAGAASAIAAFLAITRAARQRQNERLLAHATTTLQRAVEALSPDGSPLENPDRIAWLTSARLIEEYKSAKVRILDRLLIQECESHEEHWRFKLYALLRSKSVNASSYFADIDGVSAVVVHAFTDWPADKPDALQTYKSPGDAAAKLHLTKLWQSARAAYEIK
jgi:hypothetical protein